MLIFLFQANTSAEVCDEVRSILSCTRSRGLEVSQQSDILDDKAASIARNFTEKLNKVCPHNWLTG